MLLFWTSSILILTIASLWLLRALFTKNDWRLFGPMGVLMMCYIYYCAIGPWILNTNTAMEFMGISYLENIHSSALAALVSFIGVLIGYSSLAKKGEAAISLETQSNLRWPLGLYLLFFVSHLISVGGSIARVYNFAGTANENELENAISLFGFEQYLYFTISSCIACVVVLWGASLQSLKAKLLSAAFTVNLLLVFLATGFRLRIAFMALAVASFMMLRFRNNPAWHRGIKWLTMQRLGIVGGLSLLAIMAMSTARQYGRGVDLEKLKEADRSEIIVNAFNDSVIYFCSGIIMDFVRDYGNHTYFETYKAAGLRMIPSALIGEKPLPKTQEVIAQAMGGGAAAYQAGFAVPYYVENYISFGWPGLILGSFFLGAGCAWISNRLIRNPSGINALAYALLSGYAFIYFHRGYFPQQLDYFMFTTGIPMIAFWLISPKPKSLQHEAQPAISPDGKIQRGRKRAP